MCLRTWLQAVAIWLSVHAVAGVLPTASSDPALQLAYFDPGSTSFIVQAVLSVLAASAVTLKLYWTRIKGVFSRREDPDSHSDSEESQA